MPQLQPGTRYRLQVDRRGRAIPNVHTRFTTLSATDGLLDCAAGSTPRRYAAADIGADTASTHAGAAQAGARRPSPGGNPTCSGRTRSRHARNTSGNSSTTPGS